MRPIRRDEAAWLEAAAAADRCRAARRDAEASDLFGRLLAEASAETCIRTYERIAPLYDTLDAVYERMWKQRLRRRLLRRARGRVLDVGVGTGHNLPHILPGSSWSASI